MVPVKEYSVWLMLVGDSGVGKSTFATYLEMKEDRPLEPREKPGVTVGLDFKIFTRKLYDDTRPGRPQWYEVKVNMLDVPGGEKQGHVPQGMYYRAQGLLFVYDMTRRATFDNLRSRWVVERDKYGRNVCAVTVLGNKADLVRSDAALRQVSQEDALDLGRELKAQLVTELSMHDSSQEDKFKPVDQLLLAIIRSPDYQAQCAANEAREASKARQLQAQKEKESACCSG